MAPQTVSQHNLPTDDQFKSRREQTKVYAGKSKSPQSSECRVTEEDVFYAKFQKEFSEYLDRKTEKYTWKELYEKRVAKKQKKEAKKLEELKKRIGKSNKVQESIQGRRTLLIDAVHSNSPSTSKKSMITLKPATKVSQERRNVKEEGTRIKRVTAPVEASRSFTHKFTETKTTTPMMAKVLKMMRK